MIGIVTALKEEALELEKALMEKRLKLFGGFRFFTGSFLENELVLARTGMGHNRALQGTRELLEHFPVKYVICSGFAGALNPELKVGDLLIAENMSDPVLLQIASNLEFKDNGIKKGKVFSVDRPILSMKEKRRFFYSTGAMAVDMETSAVREQTLKFGIPLLAVRAISDTAQESITLFRLFRLRYQATIAGHSLNNFFEKWFTSIEGCSKIDIYTDCHRLKETDDPR